MKNTKQLLALLAVIFLGSLGSAMPYVMFAPFFLHPSHHGIIFSGWSLPIRSIVLGFLLAIYPFGQFVGSPVLGALSDQYGRKVILISCSIAAAAFFAISGYAIEHSMIFLLAMSRFVSGVVEGNLTIANACIADMAIDKHKGFGAVSAMISLGYIFGPMLAGVLSNSQMISWFDYSVPFYTASTLFLINSIGIYKYVHETVYFKAINKKTLGYYFNIYNRYQEIIKIKKLKLLFLSGFFMYLATDTYYEFFPAFLVNRWQMSTLDIAYFNAVLSVALVAGCYFIPSFLKTLLSSNKNLQMMLCIYPIMFILMIFTHNSDYLYLQFLIIGLGYGAANTFQTVLVSENLVEGRKGEIMGLSWSMRMLGDAFICIAGGFSLLYSASIPILAAFIFAITSLMILLLISNNK